MYIASKFLKQSLFIMSFLLLLFFYGCSLFDIGDDSSSPMISKMDIADASSLFIAPSNSSRTLARDASSGNSFFKITENGYIEEVTYYDENGNETSTSYAPSYIYNINADYIIVIFDYYEGYLVRKSDGAVFSLSNVGIPCYQTQYNNFINAPIIQTDKAGNIYYQVEDYDSSNYITKVIKINVTDPNNLTKVDYTPDTDQVTGFYVSEDGHIAYTYYNTITNTQNSRLKKSNGGLYNLPDYISYWLGLDNKIKYIDNNSGSHDINTILVDPNDFSITTTSIASSLYFENWGRYIFRFTDRILIIGTASTWDNSIKEVENPSKTPREFTISGIDKIKIATASPNYYYLSGEDSSGNSVLLKVNPNDDSSYSLLTPGQFDLYKISVDVNDNVTFNALRMSDGAKIIGKIDSSNVLTILDETINSEVTVLVQIN